MVSTCIGRKPVRFNHQALVSSVITMCCGCCCRIAFTAIGLLLTFAIHVRAAEQVREYEDFDAGNFADSTAIDNAWMPLKPGMRYVLDGLTVDEEGDEESHSVVFTVTDLTKVIDGVRTVVCSERDIVDGELEESEILFIAQDNDGTIWLLGEYPEEYDGDEFLGAPCWIHGVKNAQAGIMMPAEPTLGTPSYSQGWAPSVEFSDRGVVYQVDRETTVPYGSYNGVLVIDEYNNEEPDAHQLKYFARCVGLVRIGWRGDVTGQETLELIKIEQISAEELATVRDKALALEKRAYEISQDVYAHTTPSEHIGSREQE